MPRGESAGWTPGRGLGKALLYWPALSALGVAALVVTGFVRWVAQLRAAGVSVSDGVAHVSVSQYLRAGVAVVASPGAVALLMVLAAAAVGVYLVAHRAECERSPPSVGDRRAQRRGDGRATPSPYVRDPMPRGRRIRRRAQRAAVASVGFVPVCLLVPLVVWGPLAAALVPLALLASLNTRYRWLDMSSWSMWTTAHAHVTVAVLTGTFAVMAALHCYFDPPPLELASIRMRSGARLTGGLLAEADGMVYLTVPRGTCHKCMTAVPVAEIAVMRARAGRRPRQRTVPELLGGSL